MKSIWMFFLLLYVSSSSAADAFTESNAISKQAADYFNNKQYDLINEMDTRFRAAESRLSDGRWKVTFIYSQLGDVTVRGAADEWKAKLERVDEWISRAPNQPTPYLAKAKILISYAWDARGSGWAKDVPKSQWPLFRERITEARAVLENSAAISSNHPYWYLLMETIANAQGWDVEKFQRLYDSAVEAFPTYYMIHFRAADYFQPRWHGSREQLGRFVDKAVLKSKEREGFTLYTRIYWSQLWALGDDTFAPGYAEWKFMQQGFERIMLDYPESVWNLNAFAYYACMAKDWPIAKRLIDEIGERPHLGIWKAESRFAQCRSQADEGAAGAPDRGEPLPQPVTVHTASFRPGQASGGLRDD